MGRRCKCKVTGEVGNTDVFVKHDGSYFKSEEVYQEYRKRTDAWNESIDTIAKVLGYEDGKKFPSVIPKRLKELEGYGYDVVLETIKFCMRDIQYALNTIDFTSEYGRISYIFAIIEGKIMFCYKAHQQRLKEEKAEINGDTYIETIEQQNNIRKKRDISKWLEDD